MLLLKNPLWETQAGSLLHLGQTLTSSPMRGRVPREHGGAAGAEGSCRQRAGASPAPSGPNLPACLPWQPWKKHRACAASLHLGRFYIQFPFVLGFVPLRSCGVLM